MRPSTAMLLTRSSCPSAYPCAPANAAAGVDGGQLGVAVGRAEHGPAAGLAVPIGWARQPRRSCRGGPSTPRGRASQLACCILGGGEELRPDAASALRREHAERELHRRRAVVALPAEPAAADDRCAVPRAEHGVTAVERRSGAGRAARPRSRRSGRGPSSRARARSRAPRSASKSAASGVPRRSGTSRRRISMGIVAPHAARRAAAQNNARAPRAARVDRSIGGEGERPCVVPRLRSSAARSRAGRVGRVPQEPDAEGIQVLRAADDLRLRTGRHLHRRPQRLGQVQRRRRARLGHGRAGREDAARRQDGGRHLRRHRHARPARPRRGQPHDRQRRRRAADRVQRGHDLAARCSATARASTPSTARRAACSTCRSC